MPFRALFRWINSSIAHRFSIAAAAMALLACGLTGLISHHYLSREVEEGIRQRQEARTALIAQRVQQSVNMLAEALDEVTKNPLIETLIQGEILNSRLLRDVLGSIASSKQMALPIGLYQIDGTIMAGTQDSLPASLAQQGWFPSLARGGSAVTVEHGSDRIWVALPVVGLMSAQVDGAVVGVIETERLLRAARSATDTLTLRLEGGGVLLALSPGSQDIAEPLRVRQALEVETALKGLNLVVESEQDVTQAMAPLREHNARTLAAAVTMMVAVILASIPLGRSLTRPLRALSQAAQQVAQTGSVEVTLPPPGPDEVGSLSRDFGVMLHKLGELTGGLESKVAERTRSLEEVQSLLQLYGERRRVMIENAPYGIMSLDEEGNIEACNPAALKILGRGEEELLGLQLSTIAADPQRITDLLQQSSRGEGEASGHELEARHAAGHLIPIEIALSKVRDGERWIWICTLGDITQRKQAERVKDEFISTVSHELRTPLTSIRGALGLVDAGKMGPIPVAAGRLVKIALSNSERLVLLVNDILDLQKIESGSMQFDAREVSLTEIVQQSIEANEGYARSFDVSLTMAGDTTPMQVFGDPNRLMQIMCNLISNAVKFSPKQGEVEISIENRGRLAMVSVSDQGPGIPANFRDKIFSRFAQADGSDRRAKGGTGLGLAITKALVEHHAGRISFRSREGGGTVFQFVIPLLECARRGGGPARRSGGPPRILHVDDDADLLNVIATLLSFRAEVVSVRSAAEAERALAESSFDLLIIDVGLQDGNGLRLLHAPVVGEAPAAMVFTCADRPAHLGELLDWIVKDRTGTERLVAAVNTQIDRIMGSETNAA
ncbi:sensor histidine kinase [Roseomonas sp. USHLN139]|uniref:sensor histidine kinase n=1 Tax=Roseomonas sp. USHLN139 TaxID=3081298 RepID=UPI003B013411